MSGPGGISYDDVPYESQAFHETHPDHLAAVARLHGVESPRPSGSRILELGCASGGNLIPIAVELPDARLVGIDLSSRQIAAGEELVGRLKLGNVELRAGSVMELGGDLGSFDYIICHGVYSWVPPEVQEKILTICSEHLASNGVALVSYNVYPGWHELQMIREMMLYHAQGFEDPRRKIAEVRGFLDQLISNLAEPASPYAQALRKEVEQFRGKTDSYMLHEYLEEWNEPMHYHEFQGRAARHDLAVLADARPRQGPAVFPPDRRAALERLAGGDPDREEQYSDYLRGRTFRRSLLVHASLSHVKRPDPSKMADLLVLPAVAPVSPVPDVHSALAEEFRTPNAQQRIVTSDPLVKAAIAALCQTWPLATPVRTLHQVVLDVLDRPPAGLTPAPFDRGLAAFLEQLWSVYLLSAIELRSEPLAIANSLSTRPEASALSRLQAEASRRVTNLQHRMIELTEFERLVLRQLDGRKEREEVIVAIVQAVQAGSFPLTREGRSIGDAKQIREVIERSLEPCMTRLANSSLLRS